MSGCRLPCLILGLLVAAIPMRAPAGACTGPDENSPAAAAARPADGSAGLKVYVDPESGELLEGPPPGTPPEPPPETPEAEPEVRVTQQPDGTVVADVGDRYMTDLRIEIVDGEAVTCQRPAAGTDAAPHTPREGERDGDGH